MDFYSKFKTFARPKYTSNPEEKGIKISNRVLLYTKRNMEEMSMNRTFSALMASVQADPCSFFCRLKERVDHPHIPHRILQGYRLGVIHQDCL